MYFKGEQKQDNEGKDINWINGIKFFLCWIVFIYHFRLGFGYIPVVEKLLDKGIVIVADGTFAVSVFS